MPPPLESARGPEHLGRAQLARKLAGCSQRASSPQPAPALRRAVMALRPDFFAWAIEDQERFAEDDSLLSYGTVADWDRADFEFQERARKEEDPGYAGRPYLGYPYCGWARLFVDDRFAYGILSMLAAHLHAKTESHAQDVIDSLIPHRYVPGKEHGKRVEGGYRPAVVPQKRKCKVVVAPEAADFLFDEE